MKKPTHEDTEEFLEQSNAIERVYSNEALFDAIEAWKYIVDVADGNDELLNGDVLSVHAILLKNVRPDIAGSFRDCDIWIGGQKKPFVSKGILGLQVKQWVSNFNAYCRVFGNNSEIIFDDKVKEQVAKHSHVVFENIHPFEDGNGRVGRIFYNLLRLKMGLPLHIIHEGEEQFEYYKWFK